VNADDYNLWKISAKAATQITDGTEGEVILTTESLTYDTAISPDSNWVAAVELDTEDAQKNRGTLVSIDGKIQYPLEHSGEVTAIAFTNDNKFVATAGIDGLIWLWGVENGTKQFSLDNADVIYSMATSPTNSLIVAGLSNKIKVWDASMQEEITDLSQVGDINSLAFNNDGTLLATGSTEGTVLLWKVEGTSFTQTGNNVQLNGHARFLAFSSDNKWLAGGGSTGFAYLWDIATTQELARIPHGDPVTSTTFSPDGKYLFTVSRKVVRIWDIFSLPQILKDDLIPAACSHIVENLSMDDWIVYFEDEEYQAICSDLPTPNIN
ncbi:MAG TPA: hypothetical protein VLA72_11310, partial [Anaerolineales bacterium]|nr:hypothetical protein [Anaerolineales bacterium]